jgi:hypothetical protein
VIKPRRKAYGNEDLREERISSVATRSRERDAFLVVTR